MARAFWKGSISFGLVEIPVSLKPAVQSQDLSFSLLDRKDFSPVGYKRYNKNSGRDVPWDEVVRGYEYEPDEFVVLSDEELRQANVEATQTIEILEFVKREEIDPLYFETPYYVEPQKRGSKSYALLRAALEKSDKVGIARVVLRTRQRIAALIVRDKVLMLDLLRWAHELRSAEEVEIPAPTGKNGSVSEAEVRMALQLVEGMTGKWDPEEFKDEYRDDVMALVRKKVKSGKTHTIVEPAPSEEPRQSRSDVMDLMPLLKESLAATTGEGRRPAKSKRGERAAAKPTTRSKPKTKRRSA
ncbi:MAG TPA: Ku protein [Candidatus Polarisedimenticolia bacterium]|nr:Ku protein [Candidatus Polarisedimenticolia bacterium]